MAGSPSHSPTREAPLSHDMVWHGIVHQGAHSFPPWVLGQKGHDTPDNFQIDVLGEYVPFWLFATPIDSLGGREGGVGGPIQTA